ncbi:MAG: hypothetical protein KKB59_20025 [Spirochaetes bacterium]|nr:hypothetical protein [Spirochaetota bacterium]
MKLNLQGIEVKAARVLVGMKGHRPSGFNACIGAKMKNNTYAKPAEGKGGRHNEQVHRDFVQAAISCGANVGAAARRLYGG